MSPAAHRHAADLAPAGIGQADRERDFVLARKIAGLLRVGRTPEVEGQAIVGVADRGCLRVAVGAEGGEGHIVRAIEDGEDFIAKGGVRGKPRVSRLQGNLRVGSQLASTCMISAIGISAGG